MNCPKCGKGIPDGSKFCLECGSNISVVSGASAQEMPDASLGELKTQTSGTGLSEDAKVSIGDVQTMQMSGSGTLSDSFSREDLSDRYELIEEIGRGGFACVWKARDRKLGRWVAIKKLHVQNNSTAVARFRREASAIAQLNHRNIVQVFDVGEENGELYLVMELMEGGSLRDFLKKKGKLSLDQAIPLFKGIAQGLAYAHRKNLVHRDIKPANILLAQNIEEARDQGTADRSDYNDVDAFTPKIVDFGLAQAGKEAELSISGYGMGTPYYMPPEQRRDAKGVNHTADIYALGKVLYEMVTGEVPDNVDPAEIPPPPMLSRLIFKCIKSRPEDRYFSVNEVLQAVDELNGPGRQRFRASTAEGNACMSCGTVNAAEAKFCERCGTGLFRACPECGRENSVQRQFCIACGTDMDGFLSVQETLGRIEKFYAERKWSRVIKEASGMDEQVRLPGKKGRQMVAEIHDRNQDAQAAEKNRCPYCGEGNFEKDRECGSCGKGLFAPCPECGAETRIGQAQCDNCRTEIPQFSAAEDLLREMKQCVEAKEWERVLEIGKASDGLNGLNGRNGTRLLGRIRTMKRDAANAIEEIARIERRIAGGGQISPKEMLADLQNLSFLKKLTLEQERMRGEAREMIKKQEALYVAQQRRRLLQRIGIAVGVVVAAIVIDQIVLGLLRDKYRKAVEACDIARANELASVFFWGSRTPTEELLLRLEHCRGREDEIARIRARVKEIVGEELATFERWGGAEWVDLWERVDREEDPGVLLEQLNELKRETEAIRDRISDAVQARDRFDEAWAESRQKIEQHHPVAYAQVKAEQERLTGVAVVDAGEWRDLAEMLTSYREEIDAMLECKATFERLPLPTLAGLGGEEWSEVLRCIDEADHPVEKAECYRKAVDIADRILGDMQPLVEARSSFYEKWNERKGELEHFHPSAHAEIAQRIRQVEEQADLDTARLEWVALLRRVHDEVSRIDERKDARAKWEREVAAFRDRDPQTEVAEVHLKRLVPETWSGILDDVEKADSLGDPAAATAVYHEAVTRLEEVIAEVLRIPVTLEVDCTESGVEIWLTGGDPGLDDRLLGTVPQSLQLDPFQSHTLTLRSQGFEDASIAIPASAPGTNLGQRHVFLRESGERLPERDWTSPSTGMEFVWLPRLGIWVGKYEVTNGQFRRAMRSHHTGSIQSGGFFTSRTHSLNSDWQPVVQVNFYQALEYAKWMTFRDRQAGHLPEGYRYRLPTGDEWTAFAQCGDDRIYPWGNTWPPSGTTAGNYHGREGAGGGERIRDFRDDFPVTADVRRLPANRWGLHGVGGNVWEATTRTPGGMFDAWRGGSWAVAARERLTCAFRNRISMLTRANDLGFRLVLFCDEEGLMAGEGARKPSEEAPWVIELRSDVRIDLLPVSPGRFHMFAHNREVEITNPFWMGRTEVTQAQYELIMQDNPSRFRARNHPVEQVTWQEAREFCRRLTLLEWHAGRLPEGYEFRLPTEAQWEYASRAGSARDEPPEHPDEIAWHRGNSGRTTQPVASKAANDWGFHDMFGNVTEWCLDDWGAPGGVMKVERGGSFKDGTDLLRPSSRMWADASAGSDSRGFRICLVRIADGP